MGIVYRAKDRRLKRLVAIKLLPPELAFRSEIKTRFLREAETAAQLSHPNIVPIYSVDEREGLVYFVMALVEGPTLAKKMYEDGQLSGGRHAPRAARSRRRTRLRARARRDPSRHQARQHSPRQGERARDGDGLRNRARDPGRFGLASHRHRRRDRHAGVHVARAGRGRSRDRRPHAISTRSASSATRCSRGGCPSRPRRTASMLMKQITERPTPVSQLRADCPHDLARDDHVAARERAGESLAECGGVVARARRRHDGDSSGH